jgi:hypothetical protein
MMPNKHAVFPPDDGAGSVSDRAQEPEARREVGPAEVDDSGLLAAADREHLEREIAAIERAADALRRADPELETWSDVPPATMHKPRPIWLLIGVLWLSTALATIGAVFAISALVG